MPIFNRITYGPANPPEAYAVFDSSDGSFTFFRDDKGKYTDGQVSGTKRYYTGFEDITGDTEPSWVESWGEQKNTIKTVVFKDKIRPKTCYRWFSGADSLISITRLDKLSTEDVTNMGYMFSNYKLTSLDLSSFSTAKVTDMHGMFHGCKNLTNLDLSSFNTVKVTGMSDMFSDCSSLTSLNLSSFNTANVTGMSSMFLGCTHLTNLDLSGFNTAKVTGMSEMFSGCSSLTSLDLSGFNTATVRYMSEMFYGCSKLKTIYASSLFTTDAVRSSSSMFYNSTSLVGGAGTKYNQNYTGKTYARIDGGTSRPGYFTAK